MTADKHRFFSGWTIICGFLFLGMLPGCSVSRTANPSDINLVSPESPIFDKRFESVSLKDIDLENFWVHGDSSDDREPVPLDNHTFFPYHREGEAGSGEYLYHSD